jgi:hypothetical protein
MVASVYLCSAWALLSLASFYINLPIGVPSILVILLLFKTPSTAQPLEAPLLEKVLQMDFSGTALIMAAAVLLPPRHVMRPYCQILGPRL